MNKIKCVKCGCFISYSDIDNEKVDVYFEPDSHFGPEVIEFTHKACIDSHDWSEPADKKS